MDSLEKLLEGNKRYVEGKGGKAEIGDKRRKELLAGQHPFATIVCCADSRVPPEHIFDVGLGELFIVRLAGNVLGPLTLGSVEYGVEHLHTPLLVVLGHQGCGAVKATCSGGHAEGHIADIVGMIKPAADRVRKEKPGLKDGELVEAVVEENVRGMVELVKRNEIVRKLVEVGKLKVAGAKYSLETGKVGLL